MEDIHLPLLSESLLKELDKVYPDRCPAPSMSDREIWIAVGTRQVVDYLWEQHRRQAEKNITTI